MWRLVDRYAAVLQRAGEQQAEADKSDQEMRRAVHTALKKVTEDIEERFNFNTAISSIMEAVNAAYSYMHEKEDNVHPGIMKEALEILVLMLAPFAPHISEELWHRCGHEESVHLQKWPDFDPLALAVEETEVVIQVNGKVRGRILVPSDSSEDELLERARSNEKVRP